MTVRLTARIVVDVEFNLVNGKAQSRLLRNPGDNLLKHALQEIFVEVTCITQRKIQILGEAIGLKIAFLQTGPALEDPAFCEIFMGVDASEYPAQDIIFLDNAGEPERKRGCGFEDFTLVDHGVSAFQVSGTQRRQAVMSFVVRSDVSSRA